MPARVDATEARVPTSLSPATTEAPTGEPRPLADHHAPEPPGDVAAPASRCGGGGDRAARPWPAHPRRPAASWPPAWPRAVAAGPAGRQEERRCDRRRRSGRGATGGVRRQKPRPRRRAAQAATRGPRRRDGSRPGPPSRGAERSGSAGLRGRAEQVDRSLVRWLDDIPFAPIIARVDYLHTVGHRLHAGAGTPGRRSRRCSTRCQRTPGRRPRSASASMPRDRRGPTGRSGCVPASPRPR